MYALNNPLRFIDPSGYTYRPTEIDEEKRKIREGQSNYYYSGLHSGYNRTPFANAFSYLNASGGWEFSGPTGGYVNRQTGERMSAAQFNSQFLNPSYIPSTSMNYEWGMTGTVGGILPNGEVFGRPVFGYINTSPNTMGNAFPGALNSSSFNIMNAMPFITTASGLMLNEFDNAGNYVHVLPISNRIKVYNRPYVNQYTQNLKVHSRGSALFFGINQFSITQDYLKGNSDYNQFIIDTELNILGSISPQFGLILIAHDVISFLDKKIDDWSNSSSAYWIYRGTVEMTNPANYGVYPDEY